MKKHFSTIRSLVIFSILTSAAVGGFWFFLRQIKAANVQTAAVFSQIASQDAMQADFQSDKATFDDTQTERTQLSALIVPSNGFLPFVESVESIGKNAGVTLTDSLSTAPDPDSTIGTQFLLVQIEISGTWSRVVQAISLIQSMPYALAIDNLALDKDFTNSTASKSIWDASFTLRVMEYQ